MKSEQSSFAQAHNDHLDPEGFEGGNTVTPEEALEALDILSAQVGNQRLRTLWSKELRAFINQFIVDAQGGLMGECDKEGTTDE